MGLLIAILCKVNDVISAEWMLLCKPFHRSLAINSFGIWRKTSIWGFAIFFDQFLRPCRAATSLASLNVAGKLVMTISTWSLAKHFRADGLCHQAVSLAFPVRSFFHYRKQIDCKCFRCRGAHAP